ncbi:MAG: RusA family crossover junction endodeoxyribonuclease [Prevotella sp.]|jgi:Holliday junction resolvase RusA-like endonuclease
MEKETIFGQCVAKANHYLAVPGQGGRRIVKDAVLRAYERSFCSQCTIYRHKGINAPFRLIIDVYHSNKRYDLDNSLKTVLDLLQDVGAITNDNLCVGIQATKHIDKSNPRVVFGIEELEPRIL